MSHFDRIDSAYLQEPDAHQLFQDVADYYFGCGDDADAPHSARVVTRLWNFLAEIGGGGINDFLWNHCFSLDDLKQTLADLREVQALELSELLESGICISLERSIGEYLDQPGAREWARQFENRRELTPETLDLISNKAAYPEGSQIIAAYIRSKSDEL